MKKVTVTTGIFSALFMLCGVIFKFQHWPGAGVLLVLGSATTVVAFGPMLMLYRNQNGSNKLLNFLIFLLVSFATLGFIFKIMHWPGAGVAIYMGILLAIITSIALLLIGNNETEKNNNRIAGSMLLVGYLMAAFPILMGPSWKLLKSYEQEATSIRKQTNLLDSALVQTNDFFKKKQALYPKISSVYAEQIEKISGISKEISSLLLNIEKEIISTCEKIPAEVADTIQLCYLKSYNNIDVPSKLLLGVNEEGTDGKANEIKLKINSFSILLDSLDINGTGKNVGLETEDRLMFESKLSWERYSFESKNMINSIITLRQIALKVKTAELLFIKGCIQEMQEKIIIHLYEKLRKNNIKTEDSVE